MQSFPILLVSHLKEAGNSRSTRSTDIIIRDQKGGYHAINKVLVAAKSKFFLKWFEWSSPDKKAFVVDLDGKPLGAALSWVVTGQMDWKKENEVIELLEVAEYLLMDDLSSICQQVMM